MADVFISYSSHDIDVAKALYAKFEEQGISCWMDKSELRGGADWQANITAGIKSAKVFVLVYSAHAVESKWVLRELTLADDNQLFVVPYNIDGSELDSKFELILSRLQWINANPKGGKFNFEELIGVTESHIGVTSKMSGLIENKNLTGSSTSKSHKKLWVIAGAAIVIIAVFAGYGSLKNGGTYPVEETQSMTASSVDLNSTGAEKSSFSTGSVKVDESSEADTAAPESNASNTQAESNSVDAAVESDSEYNDASNAPTGESLQGAQESLSPGNYTIGNFDIKVTTDGTAELLRCNSNETNTIVVPDEINGAVITSVKSSAFSGSPYVVEIIFPDTVTSLGGGFDECKNLKKIKLPNNIEELDRFTFDDCKKLESIDIPDSVKTIKSGAFRNCSGLKSISFGSGLSDIGGSAFEGCGSLTEVTVPGNVMIVEDYAFSQCTSIESATFEEGVVSIGSGALGGCESLKFLSLPDSLSELSDLVFYSTNAARKIPEDIQITYKGNVYSKEMVPQLIKDVNG